MFWVRVTSWIAASRSVLLGFCMERDQLSSGMVNRDLVGIGTLNWKLSNCQRLERPGYVNSPKVATRPLNPIAIA